MPVAEARKAPGLKLVLTAGVPGPWSEAAKAVLCHHGVPFTPVAQAAMADNPELVAWTGCRNAPQAVMDGCPPLTGWHDILHLAERLGHGPSLLPVDPGHQAQALGLAALIAGPGGLGWAHRTLIMARIGEPPAGSTLEAAARAYGCEAPAVADAPERVASILGVLDRHLARGSGLFVGSRLSVADLFWATFSNMLAPLPREVNPMPDMLWQLYVTGSDVIDRALTPALLAHRDRIWRDHIGLPLDY